MSKKRVKGLEIYKKKTIYFQYFESILYNLLKYEPVDILSIDYKNELINILKKKKRVHIKFYINILFVSEIINYKL